MLGVFFKILFIQGMDLGNMGGMKPPKEEEDIKM